MVKKEKFFGGVFKLPFLLYAVTYNTVWFHYGFLKIFSSSNKATSYMHIVIKQILS